MGTRLQKKLAKAIVSELSNERPKTGGELLEIVGYSPATARGIPGVILEAAGVTEEVIKLGFTVEEADKTVANILKKAKRDVDRLGAADRIYKRHGAFAPERTQNTNINISANPENMDKFSKLREKYEQELLDEIAK